MKREEGWTVQASRHCMNNPPTSRWWDSAGKRAFIIITLTDHQTASDPRRTVQALRGSGKRANPNRHDKTSADTASWSPGH
jgi:hypothetical protein